MDINVVSLETAEKLKAAGFPQTASHAWWLENNRWFVGSYWATGKPTGNDHIAAPTAQEIADQLPALHTNYSDEDDNACLLTLSKQEQGSWYAGYERRAGGEWSVFADSLAEVLAALYLKLKDQPHD